jgi:hypothetical protein
MLQALSSSPTLVTGPLGARELGVVLLGPRAPPGMSRGRWVTWVMGAAYISPSLSTSLSLGRSMWEPLLDGDGVFPGGELSVEAGPLDEHLRHRR